MYTNQWSYPVAIIDTSNNINLSLSISVPELYSWGYYVCWEANNKIYLSDLDGGFPFSSPEIPGVEKYHNPTVFNMMLVTDYSYDVYSFVGETETISDIYIVDEEVSNYILNITDDTNIDKDPRLFIGRNVYDYDDYEIINIWQKEINGKDVLFFSFAVYNIVIGNVSENEIIDVDIFPNPVSRESAIQINFSEIIPACISISIFNNYGNKVDEICLEGRTSMDKIIKWKTNDLPSGVYYLVIKTENETLSEKFIVL